VIDPDYHGEIGLPLHNRGKQDYVWNIGDPLGFLFVLQCHVIKVNGKLLLPIPTSRKERQHYILLKAVYSETFQHHA
jgi:dUTPase